MLQRQSRSIARTHTVRRPVPVPRCWLMTDRRLGAAMAAAIRRMPPHSAVVIRPYAMGADNDGRTIRRLIRIARARRHWVVMSRQRGDHRRFACDAVHLSRRAANSPVRSAQFSMAVHTMGDAVRACRLRAAAVLISPVWATRSHPGAEPLGLARFARMAAKCRVPAIVLGGADADRFRLARRHGAHGWAAIDAWLPPNRQMDQKRNWVPT